MALIPSLKSRSSIWPIKAFSVKKLNPIPPKDKEEKQEATVSLAATKEISVDAAVLTEMVGIN